MFVGKETRHFEVPKNLLTSHSPVFKAMLCGGFKEAHEQKIDLPEDNVEHFQALLEVLVGWNPAYIFTETRQNGVSKCMLFLEYTEKYQVKDAAHPIIYVALRKVFLEWGSRDPRQFAILGEDIETVFEACSAGSPLRSLITSAAISFGGLQNPFRYREQELNVEGFAAEVTQQMRESLVDRMYICPLDKRARRIDGH